MARSSSANSKPAIAALAFTWTLERRLSMIYRTFGRTGLQMPVFSCGGMRYQQSWSDMPLADVEKENQRNLEATIRRALELGITHIETARGYGSSERQLGVILPTLPREELIVQTKIAPEADPAVFEKHFEESLDRLNLDYVDLLAIHGINNHELLWQSVRPGGCLSIARRLQSAGKARHIGFSTHAAMPTILDAIGHQGDGGFDYVNLHWYYINQTNWPAIELAHEHDLGVFIISPNDKGGMLYRPTDKLTELCAPLHPIVFNTLFCLARPEVHTLSLGAARPSDFDLQVSSLPMIEQASSTIAPIVERLDQAMQQAVGADVATRFAEGLPDWEESPGYMSMAIMLWLRNLAKAYDMVEYGQMRYNLLGNGGHWFEGLNAKNLESISDEQFNKAVKDSPFAQHVRDWLAETHKLLGGSELKRLSQS
ncbi:aldo/keto reductase [Aeoliella mucimassa]|uniref:L-glyceraldehyde 3-phosphate reductase n=1 Tax=Aeoliella mucimassa TaxID=2527972 RepID=A0A518AT00_9BACT|nr:aldo/keto reductase [Aeoliella mucimassa]QDU57850.1 L-glyceraldehyde 3-phosphate reductase [Aeoliella mucimassa]